MIFVPDTVSRDIFGGDMSAHGVLLYIFATGSPGHSQRTPGRYGRRFPDSKSEQFYCNLDSDDAANELVCFKTMALLAM